MTARPPNSRRLFHGAAIALTAVSLVGAQAPAQVTMRTTGEELGDMFSDVGHALRSPVSADRRDWAGAAIAGAGFAALLVLDGPVDRWIERQPTASVLRVLAPFREETGPLSRLVTARQLVPLSAVLVVAGAITDRRGLREAGLGCIAGWGVSNIVRYTTYAAISRDRPSAADGEPLAFAIPGGGWDQHSFFAGHATNAFACVSFWSARFELSVTEPVLYAAAALSALSRIADRRHWTSDTFVGIVMGIAIGRTVARRYDQREARRESPPASGTRAVAGATTSNTTDIAPSHSRLATQRPIVILWRTRF